MIGIRGFLLTLVRWCTDSSRTLYLSSVMVFVLGGCSASIPLSYSPSSVLSATGTVTVADFKYLPADSGKVEPNQVRNTAIGSLKFDQNISGFFRDAVFKEFRFVGIKVDGKDRVVTGEVEDFLIDDLGYSIDWALRVRYLVKDVKVGGSLYDAVKITKRNTAKFVNPFGALNETIKLNIDELIRDSDFIKVIQP